MGNPQICFGIPQKVRNFMHLSWKPCRSFGSLPSPDFPFLKCARQEVFLYMYECHSFKGSEASQNLVFCCSPCICAFPIKAPLSSALPTSPPQQPWAFQRLGPLCSCWGRLIFSGVLKTGCKQQQLKIEGCRRNRQKQLTHLETSTFLLHSRPFRIPESKEPNLCKVYAKPCAEKPAPPLSFSAPAASASVTSHLGLPDPVSFSFSNRAIFEGSSCCSHFRNTPQNFFEN